MNNRMLLDGFDLSGFFEGTVVENVDPDNEGKIGIVIPRLIPFKGSATEKDDSMESITPNTNKDSVTNLGTSPVNVSSSNWIWAERAANRYHTKDGASGDFVIPPVGAKVFVIFLNQDIRRPYYLPFGPAVKDSSKLVSNQQLTEKTDLVHETLEGDSIMFDNEKKVLYIQMKDGSGIVVDRENSKILVHTKDNASEISLENNEIRVAATNITLESKGNLILKTNDSKLWKPNIVPQCPFSGLPHGGEGAGITLLKGKD